MKKTSSTDWEESHEWYNSLVGKSGHYYHEHVILPKLLQLLELKNSSSLLDLGCGQGVLAGHLPRAVSYVGVDLSPSLIQLAKKANPEKQFFVADICKPLPLENKKFSHAAIVLALQNVERPDLALCEAAKHLQPGGILVIVLNHPCFRIPRQSHWGVDLTQKIQFRRMDRYLKPLKIPIQTHPGKKESASTFSFHHSLSDFSRFLAQCGFSILSLEEWISDKKSSGKTAAMENRAREEFPLFLTIKAEKR